MRPGVPGPGALHRSGPSPRGSGSFCGAVPATGYGQGRRLRTFPVAGSAGADQPDDRPVYRALRAKTRVSFVAAGQGSGSIASFTSVGIKMPNALVKQAT